MGGRGRADGDGSEPTDGGTRREIERDARNVVVVSDGAPIIACHLPPPLATVATVE
jgi:hypothetical protein